MKKIWLLYLMYGNIHTSDNDTPVAKRNFALKVFDTAVNAALSTFPDSDSSNNSEEDELADTALTTFYPDSCRKESFKIRPYLKDLLKKHTNSPHKEEQAVVGDLRRMKSGEYQDLSEKKIQELLIEASHKALDAKEKELEAREELVHEHKKKLEQKMSKKAGVAMTTASSVITSVVTGLVTYYTSTCS